jgi:hypothetical protein
MNCQIIVTSHSLSIVKQFKLEKYQQNSDKSYSARTIFKYLTDARAHLIRVSYEMYGGNSERKIHLTKDSLTYKGVKAKIINY